MKIDNPAALAKSQLIVGARIKQAPHPVSKDPGAATAFYRRPIQGLHPAAAAIYGRILGVDYQPAMLETLQSRDVQLGGYSPLGAGTWKQQNPRQGVV